MAGIPKILSLGAFLKLKGRQRKSVIVHFNGKQWATLMRGLNPAGKKGISQDGLTLVMSTLPGIDGGLVEFRCPDSGPITGAQGQMRCGGKPGVSFPDGGGSVTVGEFCTVIVRSNGSVTCAGVCNTSGKKCKLSAATIETGPGTLALAASCHCA